MLNPISKGVVAGLAALAFTADAVILPTTPAAQGFGGFHGHRPGGPPRGGGGGGFSVPEGPANDGPANDDDALAGLAAAAIIGGALAAHAYGYGGGYGYAPHHYGHRPHHPAPSTAEVCSKSV